MVRRFGTRRRIPGLRPLLLAVTTVVGLVLGVFVPVLVAALVAGGVGALGIDRGVSVLPGLGAGVLALVLMAHLILVSLERAWRLHAPWGAAVVGTDGLSWVGWLGRRFVPYGDVSGTPTLRPRWRDLPRVVVPLLGGGAIALVATDPAATLEAIERARRAHAARVPVVPPEALLPATDASAWIARVQALGAGYRSGAPPAEELAQLASDPTARPIVRAAAALALGPAGQGSLRVRAALDDVADDVLRGAMEAALEGRMTPAQVRALAGRAP